MRDLSADHARNGRYRILSLSSSGDVFHPGSNAGVYLCPLLPIQYAYSPFLSTLVNSARTTPAPRFPAHHENQLTFLSLRQAAQERAFEILAAGSLHGLRQVPALRGRDGRLEGHYAMFKID